jgi:pyrimidine-nucleoside phosphorylase
MSKKLAMNTDTIVLDVKCGSGAFMKDIDSATQLANTMVAIGKSFNKQCSALVTDMDAPLGNHVGNALEVIEVIEVLKGNVHGRLFELCVELSTEVVSQGLQLGYDVAKARVLESLTSGKALETFAKMVQYQGGNPRIVEDYTLLGRARYTYPVKSTSSGYIQAIASESVGMVSLELGAGRHTKTDSIDYSAGIVFQHHVGDYVTAGETLATLYSSTVTDYSQCESRLLSAVTLGNTAPSLSDIVLKKIS